MLLCLFNSCSRLKTTRNVMWGTSRSAINWRAARAAPCTWTASGTSGSRSARHSLVRGHCCFQNWVNPSVLARECFFHWADVDLFYLCSLLLPVCACPGETRCDYSMNWSINAAFNHIKGNNDISEGIMTWTSAQASDRLWPLGSTECWAEWPCWGFYCHMCTDTLTLASWGFTLKVIIQLHFNFPVQIGPKI